MRKIRRILNCIILVLSLFLLIGCNTPKEQFVVTLEFNNGDEFGELIFIEDSKLIIEDEIEYKGYELVGWFLDKELTIPVDESYVIKSTITIYAKWEVAVYDIRFYVDGVIFKELEVGYNETIETIEPPTKEGYEFKYWSYNEEGSSRFSFYSNITSDLNLYAYYEVKNFIVLCDYQDSLYANKDELYTLFFTDFYNFMLNNTDIDFNKFNIDSLETFLKVCLTWDAYGRDSFYGVGDSFSKYFVTIEVGGKLENQPETTFIGYCYKNNMYEEFIPFLMTFFAYWRTDEGYTGSSSDPNNTGNDFFASAWASLVDTCKFFYFTSENLNDTYSWFNSERVKHALDNAPGTNRTVNELYGNIKNPVSLPNITREGHEFLGWFNENGEKVETVYGEMTVYAKWRKLD